MPASTTRPRPAATVVAAAGSHGADASRSGAPSLSDLIAFESEAPAPAGAAAAAADSGGVAGSDGGLQDEDPTVRAQAIIGRATKVLEAARAALGDGDGGGGGGAAASTATASPPLSSSPPPSSGPFGGGPSGGSPVGSIAASGDLTRAVLHGALDRAAAAARAAPSSSSSSGAAAATAGTAAPASGAGASTSPSSGSDGMPAWATGLLARSDDDVFMNSPPPAPLQTRGDPPAGRSSISGGGGGGGSGAISTGGWPAAAAADPYSAGRSSGNDAGGGLPGLRLAPTLARATALLSSAPPAPTPTAAFADDDAPAPLFAPSLGLPSQATADAMRARSMTELPIPLQSVLELTSAFRPPERGGAAPQQQQQQQQADAAATAASAPAGRDLPDGSGVLSDGTRYEKSSGVEYGANGYWRRWRTLKGEAPVPVNADGSPVLVGSVAAAAARARQGGDQRMARVEFEETWWESSDYAGLRVMGAEKRGRDAQGGQWRERWEERLFYASAALDGVVERSAHKWARAPLPAGAPAGAAADEWEERWDEHYHASGRASKSADKWGKQGDNVWHERWGEDYDGKGGCAKWTDKWAERLLGEGASAGSEQWGDKWHEEFADGRGRKNGEVWSVGAGGAGGGGGQQRYQRWWGEDHHGGGVVRRHGHSSTGESWDDTVQMDTYYNPVPHFGYQLAVEHSPQLMAVPLRPRGAGPPAEGREGGREGGARGGGGGGSDDDDPFGPGLDAL